MAKNFVNGYNAPVFIINGTTRIEFNRRYQFLSEYFEEDIIEHQDIAGENFQKFRFIHISWSFDFSQLLDKDNALKIQTLLIALYSGANVVVVPHKDFPERYYDILISPGSKSINLHYGGRKAFGNKDFVVEFKTKKPVYSPGWVDPDNLPVTSTYSCEEFINN